MTLWRQVLAQCPCSGGGRDGIHLLIPLTVLVGLWWLGSWLWPKWKERGASHMKGLIGKIAVVVVLAGALGFVLVAKKNKATAVDTISAAPVPAPVATAAIPRLVDLGAKSCIPCKMMAPILEQLRAEQAGKLQVDFIDVHQDEAAAQQYGISLIPTQIFFDASGKELWRHEGFMAKEDILAKCRELGFELADGAAPEALATKGNPNG